MTKEEKIIVSAYTGYLMCDISEVHKYIQEKLGRPIWSHEFAFKSVQEEVKEKTKEDFLRLCEE